MAKNDTILIDGILAQRLAEGIPSGDVGEVFEYLCLQQILKNYDLTDEELESGWIDGQDDGGIDGFYLFINGHLLQDASTFAWPKSNASLELYVVNCKHHDTFREATLNTLAATSQELFDLSIDTSQLTGAYSKPLKAARDRFILAYKKLAIINPTMRIEFVYASRGDSSSVGASIIARSNQIGSAVRSFFSGITFLFRFFGASELIEEYRRQRSFTLTLSFDEALSGSGISYIVTTRLIDYFTFICDDAGNLRRYLFDSNVRDYLGDNRVNKDIESSLRDESIPDFWWLNNGITILGTNASIVGSKQLQIKDIQIVNGLQTTETIYRHFSSGNRRSQKRTVAVKVIVSDDETIRDRIIRATNNQSSVEIASLHATDKIQRDIEQILERHDWYYERRKNYFRNFGKPPERFVTPMYLAGGYVAVCMKNPSAAASLKARFMGNKNAYDQVFSEKTPIGVWPVLTVLLKSAEKVLAGEPRPTADRFLRTWRGLLALLMASKAIGTFAFSDSDLASLDASAISEVETRELWKFVADLRGDTTNVRRPSTAFVKSLTKRIAETYGIDAAAAVGFRTLPPRTAVTAPPNEELVERVKLLLPRQPFPPGTHNDIAAKLDCRGKEVAAAISLLISRGELLEQREGMLFSSDGRVVSPDEATPT